MYIYILCSAQLIIYYNTATCCGPLIGPSSGCEIKTFKQGKYAYEIYNSFFVRSHILQNF